MTHLDHVGAGTIQGDMYRWIGSILSHMNFIDTIFIQYFIKASLYPPPPPLSLSLAIIMVEVLTHETPFNDFLDYLEVDDVLDAIAGKKSITSQLPQVMIRVLYCAQDA